MSTDAVLKAPFPYAGGKSRVADVVWGRFGNVENYCEPFMGSLAVLLRRPADHFSGGDRVETASDMNHFLCNFWRAVIAEPEKVAEYADWPVMEADLHARNRWLVRSAEAAMFRERMRADPEYHDAKIAGWWVWGQCLWIGGAWCQDTDHKRQMPRCDHGAGVNNPLSAQIPQLASGTGRGLTATREQRPELSNGGKHVGRGVCGRPQLSDAFDIGRGVHAGGGLLHDKRPRLAAFDHSGTGVCLPTDGTCAARRAWLVDWMRRLADRLRLVRTCYGHWSRICDSDSTLTRLGTTGVFLDPPYPAVCGDTGKKSRDGSLYINDKTQDLNALRDEVLAWCRKWGQDPLIRVAVCGYEGDGYEALTGEGWTTHEWETAGGYANQRRAGKGKSANAKRERIWFSPACIEPNDGPTLYDDILDSEEF